MRVAVAYIHRDAESKGFLGDSEGVESGPGFFRRYGPLYEDAPPGRPENASCVRCGAPHLRCKVLSLA
jgi:hypothetical protein